MADDGTLTAWPPPPLATEAQRVLGRRLYNDLGACLTSYRDWFAEGVPAEWVRALGALQQRLTQCKRQARQAAREDTDVYTEALPTAAREEAP